jgi:two-component system nitrogen regulation response regulator NtrX
LREYRSDIPALVDHFVTQMAKTSGRPQRKFSEDALARLQSYEWPGNVRELRNVVERVMIMAPGGEEDYIRADMVPMEISSTAPIAAVNASNAEIMGLPLREAREIFEREYLLAQVTRFGGNISRTAEFVGMERSALHRKLKSLGVQSDERARPGND